LDFNFPILVGPLEWGEKAINNLVDHGSGLDAII
jgi:hypothetical protein